MRKDNGVTLIELLIVMTLLMSLLFFANQDYSHLFSRYQLTSKAENLYAFLQLAKSQSIKFNKKVYAHFCHQAETTIWKVALSEEGHCDCFIENSCRIGEQQHSMTLSDTKWVSTSADDITFTGLQASYNPMRFSVNAGSVTLTSLAGEKLKVIQSNLRLRICSPNTQLSGYSAC